MTSFFSEAPLNSQIAEHKEKAYKNSTGLLVNILGHVGREKQELKRAETQVYDCRLL